MRGPGRMSPGYTGRARWVARVVSLTAANGGPAPVLPAGPAAGENDIPHLKKDNFKLNEHDFQARRTHQSTINPSNHA